MPDLRASICVAARQFKGKKTAMVAPAGVSRWPRFRRCVWAPSSGAPGPSAGSPPISGSPRRHVPCDDARGKSVDGTLRSAPHPSTAVDQDLEGEGSRDKAGDGAGELLGLVAREALRPQQPPALLREELDVALIFAPEAMAGLGSRMSRPRT